MSNRLTYIIAGILILIMFLLAIFSIIDDSFTFDETAHIAAGYSYLTQKDYRLNPEHPPLIKDLAAIPLLFLELNFPKAHPSWIQKGDPVWWLQFDFAHQFLYQADNNPDQILLYSRIPMILLLIFLGWFLFYWTRKLYGNKVALLALFFFSFSPTFLAHGRLVTTDIGATLGVVIATYFWLNFLKEPSKKNIILASLILGISLLLKFSLILLIPFLGIITLIYAWLNKISILKYLGLSILIGLIALIFVIWPIYQFHTLNYPAQQQLKDTRFLLHSTSIPKSLIEPLIWMSDKPLLRSIAHYFTGLSLAINRSTTGHTTYFLGEISAAGWKNYFPTVYAIKEPLAFHILTLIALLYLAWLIKKPFWINPFLRLKDWIRNHFTEFAMLCFIVLYWITSLTSHLNIGVRHLLPVFPFTFLLVSAAIIHLLNGLKLGVKRYIYIVLGILLLWQAISVISIYPHFLAYFNEMVGGPDKGYIYVVNSNLDWGQDLKRLKKWVDENLPAGRQVYVDYFGGGDVKYYLKEKFAPWWGTRNPAELTKGSYLAVSASFLQGGRAKPAPGFDQPFDYYLWLNQYTPITKIGYSIFVYRIE